MILENIVPYKGSIEERNKLYDALVASDFRIAQAAKVLNLERRYMLSRLWANGFNSRDIKMEKIALSRINALKKRRLYRKANKDQINLLQRIRRSKK